MKLLDVNLLLYAHDSTSKEYKRARPWLECAFVGPEIVALPWATILAFLRIATTPRVETRPLDTEEAVAIVTDWLAQANVIIVHPTDQHWRILSRLLPKSRVRGSLIMDAHLAALAIEHGATLCTNDRDFARFPGLKVEYPLQ